MVRCLWCCSTLCLLFAVMVLRFGAYHPSALAPALTWWLHKNYDRLRPGRAQGGRRGPPSVRARESGDVAAGGAAHHRTRGRIAPGATLWGAADRNHHAGADGLPVRGRTRARRICGVFLDGRGNARCERPVTDDAMLCGFHAQALLRPHFHQRSPTPE